MQVQENSISNPVLSLSISEQLAFLIESSSVNNQENYSREQYLFTVVIGCIADLFILDKISFVNNRIKLNNNPKKVNDYLTKMMKVILSSREEKSIFYILLAMITKQMSQIEAMIVKHLIDKKLLERNREGFFILGKKSIKANNDEIRFDLYNKLREELNRNEEPSNQIIFLLTLLYGIDFLPKLYTSKYELDYSRRHLQLFIKENYIAKLLLQSIQNEIKVKQLDNMPKHQGSLSIGRIF